MSETSDRMRGSVESDTEAEDADVVDEGDTAADPVAAEAVEELEEELEEEKAPVKPAAPPRVRRLDIVSRRNLFFLLSLLIIIPGILSMSTRHFLLGIDFAGGTEFTVRFPSNPPIAQVEDGLEHDVRSGPVDHPADPLELLQPRPRQRDLHLQGHDMTRHDTTRHDTKIATTGGGKSSFAGSGRDGRYRRRHRRR